MVRKSRLAVVIEDDTADLKRVLGLLEHAFDGTGVAVGFTSVAEAIDARPVGGVGICRAQIIILDDHLGAERAEQSIARLRDAGFNGAVVILTGAFVKRRAIELLRQGAVQLLEKDQIDSTTFARILLQFAGADAA